MAHVKHGPSRRVADPNTVQKLRGFVREGPALSALRKRLLASTSRIGSPTGPRLAMDLLDELFVLWLTPPIDGQELQHQLTEQAELIEKASIDEFPRFVFSLPVLGFDSSESGRLDLPYGQVLRRLTPEERAELLIQRPGSIGYLGALEPRRSFNVGWAIEGPASHSIIDLGVIRVGQSSLPWTRVAESLTAMRVAYPSPIGLETGAILFMPWRVRVSRCDPAPELQVTDIAEVVPTTFNQYAERTARSLFQTFIHSKRLSDPGCMKNASGAFNLAYSKAPGPERLLAAIVCLDKLVLHGHYRGGEREFAVRVAALLSDFDFERRSKRRFYHRAYRARNSLLHPTPDSGPVDDMTVMNDLQTVFRILLSSGSDRRVQRFLRRVRQTPENRSVRTLDDFRRLPLRGSRIRPRPMRGIMPSTS
jgi:hypothetical protein